MHCSPRAALFRPVVSAVLNKSLALGIMNRGSQKGRQLEAPTLVTARPVIAFLLRWAFIALAVMSALAATLSALSYAGICRNTVSIDTSGVWEYVGIGFLEPRSLIVAPFMLMDADSLRLRIGDRDIACTSDRRETATTPGACAYDSSYLYLSSPDSKDVRKEATAYELTYAVHVHPYAIGGLLYLMVVFVLLARGDSLQQRVTVVGAGIGVAGLVLLGANLYGLTQPLRSPRLELMPGNHDPIDMTLAYDQALSLLQHRDGVAPDSYLRQATLAVAGSVLHNWNEELFDELRVHIPLWENWILHLLGLVEPQLRNYVFWDHRRALERGVGLCGHVASVLVGFLGEQGFDAMTLSLTGHMVVTVEIGEGRWFILDPDYGVVIPASIEDVVRNPQILRDAYSERIAQTLLPPEEQLAVVDRIVGYYLDTDSNMIDSTGRLGYYSGWAESAEWYGQREALAYQLKWPIPIALVIAGVAVVWAGNRRSDRYGRRV
jgi:hypothetical protein